MRASCSFIIHGQTARLAQDHFGTPAEVLSSVTFALQAHIDCEPCTINGQPGFTSVRRTLGACAVSIKARWDYYSLCMRLC